MAPRSAKAAFKDYGPNLMTPEPVMYGWLNNHIAWELSTGTSFMGEEMWGVSIIDADDASLFFEESMRVLSKEAGLEYIELLKEEYGTSS